MRHILVLEDDPRYIAELREAIQEIDPKLVVINFSDISDFQKFILSIGKDGPIKAFKEADAKVPLIITKNEMMGAHNITLISKIKDMFTTSRLCTKEDPTAIVVTAFEDPQFDAHQVESRLINNVIYKPFDKLLLKQHLTFAISGRHPPSEQSLYTLKLSAIVEMLKDASMIALSDVGFLTRSDRELPVGSVAKYYCKHFEVDVDKSVYGILRACLPADKSGLNYICYVTYFGLSNSQVSHLRKMVTPLPEKTSKEFEFSHFYSKHDLSKDHKYNAVMLGSVITSPAQVKSFFEDYVENFYVRTYREPLLFIKDLMGEVGGEAFPKLHAMWEKDRREAGFPVDVVEKVKGPEAPKLMTIAPETIQIVLIQDNLITDKNIGFWKELFAELHNRNKRKGLHSDFYPIYPIVISDRRHSDHEERLYAEIAWDMFFDPFEKGYLFKKLKLILPGMKIKSSPSYKLIDAQERIKVAQPSKAVEVSEAGMIIDYYRPIPIGNFREFFLVLSREEENPLFLAACNYSEKKGDKPPEHHNHFVFFGLTDHFLKHLKVWIRQNYIKSKGGE